MRKPMPQNSLYDNELGRKLIDFLEDNLPYVDLEHFLEDNNIEKFSVEMSREEGQQLRITSVYISE